jgi:hypothetical protein
MTNHANLATRQVNGIFGPGLVGGHATQFLKLLDPSATGFTFQTFHDKKPPTKPELARVIESPAMPDLLQLHTLGAGVYVTVNATDSKGRKSENITRVRAIWQEDDGGFDGKFPLAPSIVVESSPEHFHRYWLVSEEWPADEQGRADFAAVMDRMVESYGSDKNAKDISRVLRLPGFLHRKNGPPHQVRVIDESGRRYSRAEIIGAFPPVECKPKTTPQSKYDLRGDEDRRIRDALFRIDPDDRDTWLQIGMALKDHMGESGHSLWDEWSRQSPKYNERNQDSIWKSFRKNGITIGTLFHHAKQAGWAGERPHIENGSNDNKKTTESKPELHDWDDPDWSIIDERRGELPDFPLDIFSDKIQRIIKRTSHGAGVTPAHVVVPLIGIVSALIGAARRIKATRSWLQPMTCWIVLAGFSGTGKTPGINVTKRALNAVMKNNKLAEEKRRLAHETRKEAADAVRKHWQSAVKDAVEANQTPTPMPADATDPGPFVPVKLHVTDATIEKLATLLQARPQGMLVLRDELSGLFTNMSRYSGGQDNEFWLEAWNGDSYSVERMVRTLHVDHLLIGITGGMQPDKLATSFEGDHDGMYARVLFSWPAEPECADLNDEADEVDIDFQNIISRTGGLAELDGEGRLITAAIPLSAAALDRFAQFRQFAHAAKMAFEGRERDWHAKMTAHVLRVAGTLTFIEWAINTDAPEPKEIALDCMAAAIRLVGDYFWPHARACLRQIGLTQRHAERAGLWKKPCALAHASMQDLRKL